MTNIIKIDWIHVDNYYDLPLSGWIRSNGTYFWFEIDSNQITNSRDDLWYVYDIFKSSKLKHLTQIRKFRHIVGWHWDKKPGCGYGQGPKENYNQYYEVYKDIPINNSDKISRIGITIDLEKIQIIPNWQKDRVPSSL